MSDILETLQQLTTDHHTALEAWFDRQRRIAPPHLTTSVDLRHSGCRLVPVDTNLYPAGFQNLSPAGITRAANAFKRVLMEHTPQARRILIVPENHTRNLPYLDNLATLQAILTQAGLEVVIGNLTLDADDTLTLPRQHGAEMIQHGLHQHDGRLMAGRFNPDIILLNNDGTAGTHKLLTGIDQPILPPPELGWWQRRKSQHFTQYAALVDDFCTTFGINPCRLRAEFRHAGAIDFKAREGVEQLATTVDAMLTQLRSIYAEEGISHEPYAYIKADGGTYGMGIMVVRSGEEILTMNKKDRNKMQVIKEGAKVSDVIIQEGIPTIDTVAGAPAEPMMYLVDGVPVGGMYRINEARDAYANLNANGMHFIGMCDEDEPNAYHAMVEACHFHAFGLVGAIAALAAGREALAHQTSQEEPARYGYSG